MKQGIVVAGSLNRDLLSTVEILPAPGETVLGGDFSMIPHGKGTQPSAPTRKEVNRFH